jgi:hypothetical protein
MSHQLTENTIATLNTIAGILLRCFIITVGAMLFTWLVFLLLGDQVYCIQSRMIDITRGEFDLYFLYVMTFMKGLNLIFFLFPFIAIKWYLRGQR